MRSAIQIKADLYHFAKIQKDNAMSDNFNEELDMHCDQIIRELEAELRERRKNERISCNE